MSEEASKKANIEEVLIEDPSSEDPSSEVPDTKLEAKDAELKKRADQILALESKLNDFDIKFYEARGFIKKMESEVEEIRSRAKRDLQKQIDQKLSDLCLKILPSVDLFELSISAAKNQRDFDSFLKGIEMIRSQLSRSLQDVGLERIQTAGEIFDPNLHEAVMNEATADSELDGKVSRELKAGYRLQNQIVRPAQVGVYQLQEAQV